MCSNDCFFVRTSWLEAKQGNRRRVEARGSAALSRSGEHSDVEGAEIKGRTSLSAPVASATASKRRICEKIIHSFIHELIHSFIRSSTNQHFLCTGIHISTQHTVCS